MPISDQSFTPPNVSKLSVALSRPGHGKSVLQRSSRVTPHASQKACTCYSNSVFSPGDFPSGPFPPVCSRRNASCARQRVSSRLGVTGHIFNSFGNNKFGKTRGELHLHSLRRWPKSRQALYSLFQTCGTFTRHTCSMVLTTIAFNCCMGIMSGTN